MGGFLRKATVATVKLGPFVGPSDGLTPFTAGGFTVKVGANGGAVAARHDATAITYDADGYYAVEIDATDTAAVGRFKLEVPGSAGNYLPVWEEYVVLDSAVYDVLFGSVAPSTYAGGAVASVTAPVTTGSFSAGAITSAAFAAGATLPRVSLADVLTTNSDKAGYALTSAYDPAKVAAPATDSAAIKAVTDVLATMISAGAYTSAALAHAPTGGGSAQSGDVFALLNPLVASGTIKADLQTIKTQAVTCAAGVTVAAFVGQANAISTNGTGQVKVQSGTAAGQILLTNGAVSLAPPDSPVARTGTCQAGSTATTIVLDSGASSTDDAYRGMLVRLTGGTGSSIYQTRTIVSYTGATQTVTIDRAWKTTPDASTTFALIYANAPRLDTQLRMDVGSWLDQPVTLDASNLPNVSIAFASVWTAAGAPTVNPDGSVHADIVSLNEAAVTIDDIIADTITALTNYGAAKTTDITPVKAVTDKLATMLQASGSNWQFTIDALAQAPLGGGGGGGIVGTTPLTARDQRGRTDPDFMDSASMAYLGVCGTLQANTDDPTKTDLLDWNGNVVFTFDAPARVQLTPDALDLVMIEPTAGINLRQAMQQVLASAAGEVAITTVAGVTTVVINGANTAVPRIVATTDAIGERTQVNNLFDV